MDPTPIPHLSRLFCSLAEPATPAESGPGSVPIALSPDLAWSMPGARPRRRVHPRARPRRTGRPVLGRRPARRSERARRRDRPAAHRGMARRDGRRPGAVDGIWLRMTATDHTTCRVTARRRRRRGRALHARSPALAHGDGLASPFAAKGLTSAPEAVVEVWRGWPRRDRTRARTPHLRPHPRRGHRAPPSPTSRSAPSTVHASTCQTGS
jgi:hypothetical protein